MWPGLSFTSPDMNTTKAFLSKTGEDRRTDNGEDIEMTERGEEEVNSGGTLLIIEDGWGYNVQPYSQFPDEEEIDNSLCCAFFLPPLKRFFSQALLPFLIPLLPLCWTNLSTKCSE